MQPTEYLVSHGHTGDIGRFVSAELLACRRGDRVVVRSHRGLEIGTILCPATERHARLLDGPSEGELLRQATSEDEKIAVGIRARADELFQDARRLASESNIPLDFLDVEISLDGHEVTLFYLRRAECDERDLVATLSRKYEALVGMRNLALPAGASACGKPDCGNKGEAGGCTSCSSGGCSTGCGTKGMAREVSDYFAGLRTKMETSARTPLI